MERWMHEEASKTLGGKSMSKFVQHSERKRLQRLRNMKSSIVKSNCMKHDSWTQERYDKRNLDYRRQRKAQEEQERLEAEEDEMKMRPVKTSMDKKCGGGCTKPTRNVQEVGKKSKIRENMKVQYRSSTSEVTRSGLRLRLMPNDESSKHLNEELVQRKSLHHQEHKKGNGEDVRISRNIEQLSNQANRHHQVVANGSVDDNIQALSRIRISEEEKENHSSTASTASLRRNNAPVSHSNRIMKNQVNQDMKKRLQSTVATTNSKQPLTDKKNLNKDTKLKQVRSRKSFPTTSTNVKKKKPLTKDIKDEVLKKKSVCAKKMRKNGSNRPYIGPGVSLESLTKEHEEALAMLQDLEKNVKKRDTDLQNFDQSTHDMLDKQLECDAEWGRYNNCDGYDDKEGCNSLSNKHDDTSLPRKNQTLHHALITCSSLINDDSADRNDDSFKEDSIEIPPNESIASACEYKDISDSSKEDCSTTNDYHQNIQSAVLNDNDTQLSQQQCTKEASEHDKYLDGSNDSMKRDYPQGHGDEHFESNTNTNPSNALAEASHPDIVGLPTSDTELLVPENVEDDGIEQKEQGSNGVDGTSGCFTNIKYSSQQFDGPSSNQFVIGEINTDCYLQEVSSKEAGDDSGTSRDDLTDVDNFLGYADAGCSEPRFTAEDFDFFRD